MINRGMLKLCFCWLFQGVSIFLRVRFVLSYLSFLPLSFQVPAPNPESGFALHSWQDTTFTADNVPSICSFPALPISSPSPWLNPPHKTCDFDSTVLLSQEPSTCETSSPSQSTAEQIIAPSLYGSLMHWAPLPARQFAS